MQESFNKSLSNAPNRQVLPCERDVGRDILVYLVFISSLLNHQWKPIGAEEASMTATIDVLQYGKDWHQMLKFLADSEVIVDVFLCSNAYGNINDNEQMRAETQGVRIIYVGEDFFIVGPRRPIHSSIIPIGWTSMIRIHQDDSEKKNISLVGDDESSLSEPQQMPNDEIPGSL